MVLPAHCELDLAPARVERDALLCQRSRRRLQRGEQFRPLRAARHEIARRVDGIGLVERHRPQPRQGPHALPEGREQIRAAAIEIETPVPSAQRRARRRHILLPATQSQQRVHREFRRQTLIGKGHRFGGGGIDLGARQSIAAAQPPIDLDQA
ncbi:hypothetical protein D9M73_122920 [compost metagenome]